MNLQQLARMTENEAREYFESLRWPNGPQCVHCGSQKCTRLQGKKHRAGTIQCNECREQFTVKVKSVLESSKVNLVKWVLAFHLLCSSKKGFSALQLQRELGLGSYRTAWFMLHRVRHALEHGISEPMTGVVEMDETYVGTRRPKLGTSRHGRGTSKMPVVALVQRDGTGIHARPLETINAVTLAIEARKHISPESIFVTDDFCSYKPVGRDFVSHETVNHSHKEYVRTREDGMKVHTQTVDCFFSLVKRSSAATLFLSPRGRMAFTKKLADETKLANYSYVRLWYDEGAGLIGVELLPTKGANSLRISRRPQLAAIVSAKGFATRYCIEPGRYLLLRHDTESGLYVFQREPGQ